MKKRDKACFIIGTILIIAAIVLMGISFIKQSNEEIPLSVLTYHEDGRELPTFERR